MLVEISFKNLLFQHEEHCHRKSWSFGLFFARGSPASVPIAPTCLSSHRGGGGVDNIAHCCFKIVLLGLVWAQIQMYYQDGIRTIGLA